MEQTGARGTSKRAKKDKNYTGNRALREDLTVQATFEQRANGEGLSYTHMWGDKRDAAHVQISLALRRSTPEDRQYKPNLSYGASVRLVWPQEILSQHKIGFRIFFLICKQEGQ